MADLSFPQQDGQFQIHLPIIICLKFSYFHNSPKTRLRRTLPLSSKLEAANGKLSILKHHFNLVFFSSKCCDLCGGRKLVLHPNGNKNKGITDHISLYLLISQVSSSSSSSSSNLRPPGWEIRALFRLYLLDQINDTYLTIQDTAEKGRRFHGMKLEWGFDKFIPHTAFKDDANGYLVNDTCVFGAEVYVCQEKHTAKGESLSMIKDAISYKNTWRIDKFNSLTEECVDSKPFNAADHKWKMQLYPRGKGSGAGSHISFYLTLAEPENLPPATKIYAEFTLRMLDQLNRNHNFGTANYWFSASNPTCGWPRFASHGYFNLSTTGLLVKNICLVEAEVIVHGVADAI